MGGIRISCCILASCLVVSESRGTRRFSSGFLAGIFFCCLAIAPQARGQSGPEGASSEWQVWTGGGHGINGSQSGTAVWNLGLRYGRVLTDPHGPGFLQGQLEYAVDLVPAWVIVQSSNTAYGAGV